MNIEYFGNDNKLATVSVNNKYVTGYIVHSQNNKYSLIYKNTHSSEDGELNLAFINGDSVVFKRIVRPMKAVISDLGVVALINLLDIEAFEHSLEFYDIDGKLLKKFKTVAQILLLTPDQKYLLAQNLVTKEKTTDRMLTIYEVESQKKVASIHNFMCYANFEISEDSKTLRLSIDESGDRFCFKYAEINLDFDNSPTD